MNREKPDLQNPYKTLESSQEYQKIDNNHTNSPTVIRPIEVQVKRVSPNIRHGSVSVSPNNPVTSGIIQRTKTQPFVE